MIAFAADERVMRGFPVPARWRITPANVYTPPFTHWFMQHVREVERTAAVAAGDGRPSPLPSNHRDLLGTAVRSGDGRRWTLAEMLEATWADGFIVLHGGRVVMESYFRGMRADTQHMYQSMSKSLGACVAANLVERGLMGVEDPLTAHVPELVGSGYDGATVRDLLDMTVGVRFSEEYDDDDSEVARLDRLYGVRPSRSADEPGSSYEFAAGTAREGEHGTVFHYVSLNLQVLGWVMERATGVSVPDLIAREVWSKLGVEGNAYIALDGAGSAQLEGGFCSTLRDLARFGLMLCGGGTIDGRQVVPGSWVDDICRNGDKEAFARADVPESQLMPGASYRDNFWVSQSADHTAFMCLGIYGQLLYVNREADLVVAEFSTWPVADDPTLFAHEFHAAESLAQLLA